MNKKIDIGITKVNIANLMLITRVMAVLFAMLFLWNCKLILSHADYGSGYAKFLSLSLYIKEHPFFYLPYVILILSLSVFQFYLKKLEFNEKAEVEDTSGNFGTARFATKADLKSIDAFTPQHGNYTGTFEGQPIYLPLYNKLTISPPGGGKTTVSSIPILLSHDGPILALDIKGELCAVTARHRAEKFKRQVVVVDPFGVTKSAAFRKNMPQHLLKDYHINPFDFIPTDKFKRDRMINAFASSFVICEDGVARHFDENAKILIRGYIDYLMHQDKNIRNLPMLYTLMSENVKDAQTTFDQMSQLEGRAGAAANQINRVGTDERGSILSTSYRQIDWMGDSNIRACLAESNFNLQDFLKGNMDIFVVLPEDQVKEHNRLFRMIMSLLMSMIVSADPSELPKKKILFLLEELAQLGPSPDVEQCIEVLRIRGVVVWTVFQTLKQIELFDKPDLFLSVPIKQIFTNDDVDTMEWIQTLGGKKTILTKTLSNNKGDSRQKMQMFHGSVSKGEGESIQETAADLIQLNEIRELPYDEQLIFMHGLKPIHCKKVRYFEAKEFANMYDPNPLEIRNNS